MKLSSSSSSSLFLLLILLVIPFLASCDEKQVHIVYFGEHKGDKALHEIEAHHHSYLLSVKDSEEEARSSLLYSYKHSFNGFAAKLTAEEASKLAKLDEMVSVFKTHPRKYEPHTTRSWQFVGLEEDEGDDRHNKNDVNGRFKIGKRFLKKAKYGDGIIVGVVDSGVWPESKSFSDRGMGPIPNSWKGICQTGTAFNSSHCNRKIIGARYYVNGYLNAYGNFDPNANRDYLSPRDADGHGSHTASTSVGRRVPRASALGGYALGTASGGAPNARLAIYKACWAIPNQEKSDGNVCLEEDMLAAIDDAIGDGVHVLSLSIGTKEPVPFSRDGIAMGALHAARRNIVVVASAGNSGPGPGTLSNPAPWIMTVGASSLDRSFVGGITLGNGYTIKTESLTAYKMDGYAPLVYAADVTVPGSVAPNNTPQCLPYSLSPELVRGKVVLCLRGAGSRIGKSLEVKRAGGVGMILGNSPTSPNLPVDPHFVPAAGVTLSVAEDILSYIRSYSNPVAFIEPGQTVYGSQPAPFVTDFSSRGPNVVDPNILKPDITAPGLNILAAWSGVDPPTKDSHDPRVVAFNVYSGTSMSCPHVSGAIALLKAIRPNWSSAAIRSAIMTTAWMTNNEKKPIKDGANGLPANPFALGSGHFRPTKAADPGLVYDATYQDYLLYSCSVGLTNVDPEFRCPMNPPPGYNLNYPSIAIPNMYQTVQVRRSVTNVGSSNGTSTYTFSVNPPYGVSVTARPSVLRFTRVGQTKQFTITVTPQWDQLRGEVQAGQYLFGRYTWTDGRHVVRSPMAVSFS